MFLLLAISGQSQEVATVDGRRSESDTARGIDRSLLMDPKQSGNLSGIDRERSQVSLTSVLPHLWFDRVGRAVCWAVGPTTGRYAHGGRQGPRDPFVFRKQDGALVPQRTDVGLNSEYLRTWDSTNSPRGLLWDSCFHVLPALPSGVVWLVSRYCCAR